MWVCIYILLLSVWTINCLDKNETNTSSTIMTTVDKTTELTEARMDGLRKYLLTFIVGIMTPTFIFICFCILYYNFKTEEVPSPGGLSKEKMAAVSSWVSKVSACQPDMITEDILESQPLLLNSNNTYVPSHQEKLSNSAVKSIQPSNLEKPSIPSNAQRLVRNSDTETSSIPCTVKKSSRQLDSKKPTKSSSPQRLHKLPYQEKSRKRNLKKSRKLSNTCKLASQVNSTSSERQVIPPWLTILQSSGVIATQSFLSVSRNQILPTKPSRIRKPNQSRGRHDQKKPVSTEKAVLPRRHPSAQVCQRYQDKCLSCNTCRFLSNDLLGPSKKHAGM